MKHIFLMRHGETLFNTMDINQGQCDSPLTENGIHQAQVARQWFENNNIKFDAVYSSTSERACDTAEIASGGMSYTRLKGLKEIYLGTREASPNSENPTYPYGDFFVKFGGEDLDEFTNRIYTTIKSIADDDNGDVLLIVSHGMAIKRFFKAISHEAEKENVIGNCGIVELEYKNSTFHVKQIINPN